MWFPVLLDLQETWLLEHLRTQQVHGFSLYSLRFELCWLVVTVALNVFGFAGLDHGISISVLNSIELT